jgi:SPP1 family predicted phage head-tail adaptor
MKTLPHEIGLLRSRVALEAPVETADEVGGVTRAFVAIASVWAEIVPLYGEHRFEADREEASITHRVLIRWLDGVSAGMRFSEGGRILMIRAVYDPDERHRFLFCRCEEIAT